MRFKQLTIDNKSIKSTKKINTILKDLNFYWLIDSEFENAHIEIKNNTLIWHSGEFYTGNWHFNHRILFL